jgi:thioester reductase-like protein
MSGGIGSFNPREAPVHTGSRLYEADAALPIGADLSVQGRSSEPRAVLLTGATGFLGRQLLRVLLQTRSERIVCLVRAGDTACAAQRLGQALAQAVDADAPLSTAAQARLDAVAELIASGRVQALAGDLSRPRFGLSDADYEWLCTRIGSVVHAAADVNWAKGYRQLRAHNVLTTAALIRFCFAAHVQTLLFVSTLAVCFAHGVNERIDESSDLFDAIDRMPLGYAQSKCVAERLLRRAAAEGLGVTIVRPGLLCGDTHTGAANTQDIVSAILRRCAQLGEAPDADWLFESLPVDHAARAIIALGSDRRELLEIHHLRHPRPRHWRELVLWLNLNGHHLRIVPTADWLDRAVTRDDSLQGRSALSDYRRLFLQQPGGPNGALRPFEVYLSRGQQAVCARRTEVRLATLGLAAPPLDQALLRRHIRFFERSGVLAAGIGARHTAPPDERLPDLLVQRVEATLCRDDTAPAGGQTIRWRWQPVQLDTRDGLLSEVASIGAASGSGLARYRVVRREDRFAPLLRRSAPADIVMKWTANDRALTQAILQVAALADPALGRALLHHPRVLGMEHSHRRESALYHLAPEAARRHIARCFSTVHQHEAAAGSTACWGLAMAYVPGRIGGWQQVGGWQWSAADRNTAILALAELQAAWHQAGAERVAAQACLGPPIHRREALALAPAWHAMADFAAPIFEAAGSARLPALHRSLLGTIGNWWDRYDELPRTLIHNDFNPRNLVLREGNASALTRRRICVLDWELATLGPPQQDLAELLCFVLPATASAASIASAVELHRHALAECSGLALGREAWVRGFQLALNRLLVQRLPLYALVHRFQPQPFLPALLANWVRLQRWAEHAVLFARATAQRRCYASGPQPAPPSRRTLALRLRRPQCGPHADLCAAGARR